MPAETISPLNEITNIKKRPSLLDANYTKSTLDEEQTQKLPNYLQVLGNNFKVPLDESKFKSLVFRKDKEEYPDQIDGEIFYGISSEQGTSSFISERSDSESSERSSESSKSNPNYTGKLIVDKEIKTRESSQVLDSRANLQSDEGFDLDF